MDQILKITESMNKLVDELSRLATLCGELQERVDTLERQVGYEKGDISNCVTIGGHGDRSSYNG